MDIKRVLKKYNITQKEVADKLNISKVTLCISIAKKDNINLSTLRKIATVVGCSMQEFFEDEQQAAATDNRRQPPTTGSVFMCPYCGKRFKVVPLEDEGKG